MWTQKDVIAFKNAIKKESKMEKHTDCIIKVGSGETVTVSSAGRSHFHSASFPNSLGWFLLGNHGKVLVKFL